MTIYTFKVIFDIQGMEYLDRVLQSYLLLFENLIHWAGNDNHNYRQIFLSNCTETRFGELASNIVKTY